MEFGNQIQNFNFKKGTSSILLKVKNTELQVSVENETCSVLTTPFSFDREVFYIDSPFILDDVVPYREYGIPHRYETARLIRKTVMNNSVENALDSFITNKRLEDIYLKINSACAGRLSGKANGFIYYDDNTKNEMKMCNVSTGLKSFIIIKTILANGLLIDKGCLILDEPEIHLHPAWQKLFAEIIVLLQKEYNLHILINSHSPYFIDAIDVFSSKYGIRNSVKFYLTEEINSTSVNLKNCSENLEPIYDLLAKPLQELENERY